MQNVGTLLFTCLYFFVSCLLVSITLADSFTEGCVDTAQGLTDSYGDGCYYYKEYPAECGDWDTKEFTANLMCCACKETAPSPEYESWDCTKCKSTDGYSYCRWNDQFHADGGCLPDVADGIHVPCGEENGDSFVHNCAPDPCKSKNCGDLCIVGGDMAGACDGEGQCSFEYNNLGCGFDRAKRNTVAVSSREDTSDISDNSIPNVACMLNGYNSPVTKSNLLQFDYTSPEYPSSIDEMSSGLCVLRIDHNWVFPPRNNGTNSNETSSTVSTSDSSSDISTSDEDFYEELCNSNGQSSSGGQGGGGGTNTGEEEGGGEGEGNQPPNLPPRKPKICQVRLDFLDFKLQPPILGDCRFDKMFALSGSGNDYPILCGWNEGHHMYLDVADKSTTDLTFVIKQLKDELYTCLDRFELIENLNRNSSDEIFQTTVDRSLPQNRADHAPIQVPVQSEEDTTVIQFNRNRSWKIRITQLPCGCSKFEKEQPKAPDGCLMYYPKEVAGTIKSFNYDHVGCYSHEHVCDVSDLSSCAMTAGFTGHLNNLDYSICVEQQYGFCGVEYSAADPAEIGPFSLSNTTKTNSNIDDEFGVGGAASGDANCLTDYMILHGGHCKNDKTHYETDRFCGNSLGVSAGRNSQLSDNNGSPTDAQTVVSFKKPFHVQVVTDSDEITASVDYMNRGFHLKYHQLPCQ